MKKTQFNLKVIPEIISHAKSRGFLFSDLRLILDLWIYNRINDPNLKFLEAHLNKKTIIWVYRQISSRKILADIVYHPEQKCRNGNISNLAFGANYSICRKSFSKQKEAKVY